MRAVDFAAMAKGATRRRSAVFVITAAVLVPIGADAAAAVLPPGFADTVVWGSGQGIVNPAAVAFAPNGEAFVAEQDGRIWSFANGNDTSATLMADLRPVVYTPGDHGISDIVVDPQYPARPFVYAQYTLDAAPGTNPPSYNDNCPNQNVPGCPTRARVVRLEVDNGSMVGSETILFEGGCFHGPYHGPAGIDFGADGYLYAASGEGARTLTLDWGQSGSPPNPCGDPPGAIGVEPTLPASESGSLRSQDLRTMNDPLGYNGTVIRIHPDTGLPADDNPLIASDDLQARKTIAHGFRMPWRIAFRPDSDELYVGDVGANSYEEIDRIPDVADGTVENFGWPCYEGTPRMTAWDGADSTMCEALYAAGPAAVTTPHLEWPHAGQVVSGDGCPSGAGAVTGLAFYEGGPYPADYDGAMFFSDLVRDCIYVTFADATGVPDPTSTLLFASGIQGIADLTVSPAGELYYTSLFGCNCVRRIRYSAGNAEPNAVAAADVTYGSLPLNVQFNASASSDPEGGALQFAWDLDGDGQFDDSTIANPSRAYTNAATIDVGLRVTDPLGAVDTDIVRVRPGESPPDVNLIEPTATTFAVGDSVAFSATATDLSDGPLPASAFAWEVVEYHCNPANLTQCHQHQLQQFDDVVSGSFLAPDHELPSNLEVRLTVTDSAGLTATASRAIEPLTQLLSMRSNPPGITLGVNLVAAATPSDVAVIESSEPIVSAPLAAKIGGTDYEFVGWSDGGAAAHAIPPVVGPRTLTADYRAIPIAVPALAVVTEPAGSGSAFIDIPVTLTFATDRTVTIPWTTVGHTATSGADFAAASGTATIVPGQTQTTVRITVLGDLLDEADEVLLVSFQTPTNAKLGGFFGLGFGVITDNDPLPVILPTLASVAEGDSGTTTVQIPVLLDRPSGRAVSAGFVTLPWSASQGSDFDPAWGTVTFAPGQTQTTVSVTVRADTVDEADEVFFIWVVEPTNAIVGGFSGIGVGQIIDDDG
jgi:glucose/arabinose dehydrogenase/PKD repeat protein